MKALVLKEYGRFSYEDVDMPKPGKDDVLIRVKACAICGSDVHGMDGSTGRRIPPIVMGHETSGVIESVGENVTKFKPGDRVTVDSTIYCGECGYCLRGEFNLCDNRKVLGVSCSDYRLNGAFAEYIAVPQRIVYRLPDNVSFEQATVIEPLAIALHAVKRSGASLNNTAVVVGAGMIGLLIIQLLKTAGCSRIIAVDKAREKLVMAEKFGADVCLLSDTVNLYEKILAASSDKGADIAFLPESEYVAVCGRNISKVNEFAEKYNVKGYTSIEDMAAKSGVEAVVVCTPHPVHAESAIPALRAGLHVLVEKPLSTSLADCDAMIKEAEENGVILGGICQRRFYTPVQGCY